MHWCQYLALNYKVYAKENGSIKFDVNFLYTIIFVIAYAFIMTFIETLGFKEINVREGTLILIFLYLVKYCIIIMTHSYGDFQIHI